MRDEDWHTPTSRHGGSGLFVKPGRTRSEDCSQCSRHSSGSFLFHRFQIGRKRFVGRNCLSMASMVALVARMKKRGLR